MWYAESKSYIANSINELEDDCCSVLMQCKGNAIVVFTDVESEEDMFVAVFRDFDLSMDEWEYIERYIQLKGSAFKLRVYPLDGTRYTIDHGILDDSCRTRYISVIKESDVVWIQ